MTGPEMAYAAMSTAIGEVREAAGRLHQERAAVDLAFRSCVGASWTGAAAGSFLEVFETWHEGLLDVQQGLAAMAELLDAAKADLMATDGDVTSRLDAISSRIVDRLGR